MTTTNPKPRTVIRNGIVIMSLVLVTGCSSAAERLANIGKPPPMAPIENPIEARDYRPVSMPMPEAGEVNKSANSLWQPDRQAFFKDQRASAVGDILTVLISIDDEAKLENETERIRSNSDEAGVPNFLGLESKLGKVLPDAVSPDELVSMSSDLTNRGEGSIDRSEEIELKVAAVVSQILPNGNMVIHGRQEVRVNFEKRILQIAGVIRPEDISIQNAIPAEKIAEARIAYGGEGQITDVQQPRYGSQAFDILFPF